MSDKTENTPDSIGPLKRFEVYWFLYALVLGAILGSGFAFTAVHAVGTASAQNEALDESVSVDLGSATFEGCTLEGSTMYAHFDVDRTTSVTLYDAGVFTTEGAFEVPSKSLDLSSGSSTVEMPVTVESGSAALFIDTPAGSTGCRVDEEVAIFDYSAGWLDVRLTYLALLLAAPFTFGTVAWRYKQDYDERSRLL